MEKYYQNLDSKEYLNLCLSNLGTNFDEDVDIKISIKEGSLCELKNLPIPGNDILEEAGQHIENYFKVKESLSINEYEDYPSFVHRFTGIPKSYQEQINDNKRDYYEKLEDIFYYDYFKENGYDIIRYKHHT